jgi:hypothetical protein
LRVPFGRAKPGANAAGLDESNPVDLDAPSADPSLPDKTGRTQSEMEEDLVAAARRAAQAAALRAAERTGGNTRKWTPSGASLPAGSRRVEAHRAEAERGGTHRVETPRVETPSRRGRPLLMVLAAVLLALSAVLLYGRLRTKSEPEPLPPAAEDSAPLPSGTSQNGPLPGAAEKAPSGDPKSEIPPAPNSSSEAPDAPSNSNPAGNRESDANGNSTSVAKSAPSRATGVGEPGEREPLAALEGAPQAEPAALQSIDEPALPPGVVFSVEEPAAGY